MLEISADDESISNAANCQSSNTDGECYRKFNVRLVRPYHAGGVDYKYDPFQ